MKRSFDIVVSALGLVLTSPLFVLTAVIILVESGRPVFYSAVRSGRDGKLFKLYKFRTMEVGDGPAITGREDPRITRIGRVLRDWKIDELPQLWNVVLGDMSLVGPRPEDPRYVATYTAEEQRVLSVRPGITGPAAIAFRHEEALLAESADIEAAYMAEVLPKKLQIDLQYVENRTFLGDLRLIGSTVRALAR